VQTVRQKSNYCINYTYLDGIADLESNYLNLFIYVALGYHLRW